MLILLILLNCLYLGAAPIASGNTSADITIASLDDLFNGYDHWRSQHPNAVPHDKPFRLDVPFIDLYSQSGTSVYHGTDSQKNAEFLDALPQTINSAKSSETWPSLKEAIEMFPEFKAQENSILTDKRYTVFAVTYPDWDRCKSQNEAVQKLRERAGKIGIRVLEVRLHT